MVTARSLTLTSGLWNSGRRAVASRTDHRGAGRETSELVKSWEDADLRRAGQGARRVDRKSGLMTPAVTGGARLDVLVVGAGLSGIGAGHYLQTHCPWARYEIFESRSAIGGTWDLFRYPGIRSDSDMHTLGYSFRPWVRREVDRRRRVHPPVHRGHGRRDRGSTRTSISNTASSAPTG